MEKANLGPNMQGEVTFIIKISILPYHPYFYLSFCSYFNILLKKQSLSTHEKELARLRTEIEEMERSNLEPKTWTMQGEVIFY